MDRYTSVGDNVGDKCYNKGMNDCHDRGDDG